MPDKQRRRRKKRRDEGKKQERRREKREATRRFKQKEHDHQVGDAMRHFLGERED